MNILSACSVSDSVFRFLLNRRPILYKLHCFMLKENRLSHLLLLLLSRFSRARLTLCDPIDCSPPGSAVPGILQASTLEGVAISFSIAWEWKVKVKPLSRVRLIATPWTAAYQAPPSMGFSRQEYWSGVPLPAFSVSHPKICHFGMRSWRQWRPSKPRKNFVSRP